MAGSTTQGLFVTGVPKGFGLSKDYNAFLQSPLWEDQNGMPLSMLSALARLNVDPWQEAAALAGLPSEAGVQRLKLLLDRLPGRPETGPDLRAVCVKSMHLLPLRPTLAPSIGLQIRQRADTKTRIFMAGFVGLGVLGWLVMTLAFDHRPAPAALKRASPASLPAAPTIGIERRAAPAGPAAPSPPPTDPSLLSSDRAPVRP